MSYFKLFLLFQLVFATLAYAGLSPTQICAASLNIAALENDDGTEVILFYDPNDTALWTAVYTYDIVSCSKIAIQTIILTDNESGDTYTCDHPTIFGTTGVMEVTCGVTNSHIAEGTSGPEEDWDINIRIGVRPNILSYDVFFQVENNPIPPSAAARRRRRAFEAGILSPQDTSCAVGLTACPVAGRKGLYECLDLSSDINACGGCPGTPESADCAILDGAGSVNCIMGTCVTQSCARTHELRQSGVCVEKRKRSRFR